MKIEIVNEKENPLFKRKEVVVEISHNVAPKTSDVIKELAGKFKAKEEGIKVNKINGRFGTQKFSVTANIYDSKSALEKYEIKTKKQREAEKKAVAEAAKAAADAKKAAKTSEEKTE